MVRIHGFEPDVRLGKDIICFTTSIYGGVSKNNYFSFNLGAHVGDNPLHVDNNRSRVASMLVKKATLLAETFGTDELMPLKWLQQKHTSLVYDYACIDGTPCDGVFTTSPNTPLAIMTADCMPLVIYCTGSKKLMALHAGWRGLLDGVIQAGLCAFDDTKHLKVWIGPSISQQHFEVSHDVIHHFDKHPAYVKANVVPGKWKIDLPNIAEQILREAGVLDIQVSQHCTYQNKDCFSHRRAGHTGFNNTGRLATIAMRVG